MHKSKYMRNQLLPTVHSMEFIILIPFASLSLKVANFSARQVTVPECTSSVCSFT